MALAPPVVREALPVPVWVAHAWLAQTGSADVSDVEGVAGTSEESRKAGRRALRWRGPEKEESEPITPDQIVPGEALIVPASYGGADEYGWNPVSTSPVKDIGDQCANEIAHEFAMSTTAFGRRPYRLRLDIDRIRVVSGEIAETVSQETDEEIEVEPEEEIIELLQAYLAQAQDRFNIEAAQELLAASSKERKLVSYPSGTVNGLVLSIKPKTHKARSPGIVIPVTLEASDDHTDSDDTASTTGVEITLRDHCRGVGDWARTFATDCGLTQKLIEDLELAGRLHDLGKADHRFQIWLHGGDEFAEARVDEPLAKSGMQPNDRAAIRAARERAGYPEGARHELLSVALVRSNTTLRAKAHDWELVIHLVGTHHGRTRPFPPVVFDSQPLEVTVESEGQQLTACSDHGLERLNSGWVEQFWMLVRRYGVWGLAYLEALLRLADYTRSAEEQARNGK